MVGNEYILLSSLARNVDSVKNSSTEFTRKRSQS